MRTAFRHALGPRPGPVHLDIPQDVLAAPLSFADDEFDLPPTRYRALHGPRPAVADVDAAVALLRGAQRPLIVAGGGVVAADAAGLVRTLAARTGAGIVPTQMALGVLPSDDPLFIGHGGLIAGEPVWRAFEQADVIVSVGCRWSSWLWDDRGPFARRSHRLININLDATALGAPALHEVAMAADAAAALQDLLAAWGDAPQPREDWRRALATLRTEQFARLQALAADAEADAGQLMHPAALAQAVGQALPADALAVFDGGHTTFWSNDFTPVHAPRTRLHEPGMSHLGFGLPSAMALQLLHPGRPVFNITGDGSFGFTVGELDSARRHRLPVITVVHNNAAWGIIRHGQRMALDFELGTSLDGTDHAAVARGFGCHGETVHRADELQLALDRAVASGLPAVIDCHVRFVPHPCMPGFGRMNRFGFDALTRI
jgi:acetolactate synthase-1/2/3 large subunit